jgi:HlyD family secretion protein
MGDVHALVRGIGKIRMRKKWIVLSVIALLVVVPVTLKILRSDDVKKVDVEKISSRSLTPSILASGTLIYESQITLASEVVGRVKEVLVKEGDVVKEGQLLLRLDPETYRAEIAQIQAGFRQAELNINRQQVNSNAQEAKYKRYEALRAQGMIEAVKFDDFATQRDLAVVELRSSREALKQTEAQLKQAQERLAKTEIRAPVSGKVTAVNIKVGETAVPSATSIAGSSLMVIADTGSLYAEVNIDETDIARISKGQEAKIVPAAFPDKSLTGQVEQVAITPRQQPGQSKTYPIKIRLQPSDGVEFRPGMSCRAEVSTKKSGGQKSLAVPVQAVRYEDAKEKSEKGDRGDGAAKSETSDAAKKSGDSKASILIAVDGKAIKREVEVGIADDAYIEVLKGANENELVIVGPPKIVRFLRDGEKIAVSTPANPAAKTEKSSTDGAPSARSTP